MLNNRNGLRFPFEWKDPSGYLIVILIQFQVAAMGVNDGTFLWSLVLTAYLYQRTAAKDLKRNVKMINKLAKKKQNRTQTMKKLTESLEFYAWLKRYYILFSTIFWWQYANVSVLILFYSVK